MKPAKENFAKWNEEHALKHNLDKFYNHPNRLFRYIENKRIRILLDFAKIESDSEVLEVGCGTGHIIERIKQGKITGIDVSEVQVKRAKKRIGDKANIICAPGENIPFPDKFFDRIICTEVFEHVLKPAAILDEMHRTLKDNGIISVSVPNEGLILFTKKLLLNTGFRWVLEPRESGWDLASKNNLDEWHIHKYSLSMILEQVKCSFTVLKKARIPFGFIPFRYVIQMKKKEGYQN